MIQTTLFFRKEGPLSLSVPEGRVKKYENVPPPSSHVLKALSDCATFPMFRGRSTRARRVLILGKPYYWKQRRDNLSEQTTAPKGEILAELWKWAKVFRPQCNSILVNVYDEPSSNIGWHCDNVRQLKSPLVSSFSFAKDGEDEGKLLAEMEFSRSFPTVRLRDKTRIDFDAVKHASLNVKHRVRATLCPRINLTLRELV